MPGAIQAKQPDDGTAIRPDPGVQAAPFQGALPKGVVDVVPFQDRGVAKGVLSDEDVLAYGRQVFGGSNKEANQANPVRDKLTEQIRDHIKKHGTNFKAPITGKFDVAINEQGTRSAHIIQAVNDNYGAPPQLQDYFGVFLLRTTNRGSSSVKPDATGRKWLHIIDEQHESGRLTINRDGTYEWELLRGDPPAKWVRGRWREAKPGEMIPTEGGPAIWLDHTNGGEEYMVRMDREPGYAGWINVGVGPGRRPVQYGRPKIAK